MTNLTTNYLGLTLKSPLVISSSGLSGSVEKIRKFEEFGAGAVVLKSLFEEQIKYESGKFVENSLSPEANDYITRYSKSNALEEYLKLIEASKKAVGIPVIASINCMSVSEWISFAKDIEKAGADALELNIFYVATDKEKSSEKYEKLYNDLLVKVKDVTNMPLAIKIGYYFTNLVGMVQSILNRGAKGVVMFNRFYEPDIDIDNLKMKSSGVFSSPQDIRQSLRWVGIISNQVKNIDIAASTGIHDGKAAIKQLLVGAKVVQICSVLYKKGDDYLKTISAEMQNWMDKKEFKSIDEFRGKLNYKNIPDPSFYERSQFMKYFSNYQ
jgi:dihydroorotate dehydrogenase (fumarate)